MKSLNANRAETPQVLIATSKLLAAIGASSDAVAAARQAMAIRPVQPEALEQLASLFADAGETAELDALVASMRTIAPDRAGSHYFAAVAAFLHGKPEQAVEHATRAVAIDPAYAPVYDLVGAAYTKLGQAAKAREAFETSLRFDAHDSTAYTNLGLLELAAGNKPAAARYFAEALWLAPDSATARQGLAQTR